MRFAPLLPWLVVAGAALTAPAISCAAPAWQQIGPMGPDSPFGLVADPAHRGVVLGMNGRTIVRSTDEGRTFRPVALRGRSPWFITAGYGPNAGMYVATSPDGFVGWRLLRSRDGGRHFRLIAAVPKSPPMMTKATPLAM